MPRVLKHSCQWWGDLDRKSTETQTWECELTDRHKVCVCVCVCVCGCVALGRLVKCMFIKQEEWCLVIIVAAQAFCCCYSEAS